MFLFEAYYYLKNKGNLCKKIMSSLSAASPSASTAQEATVLAFAMFASSLIAASDSPVLITSSTIRTRLPFIISASSEPINNFCSLLVVIDLYKLIQDAIVFINMYGRRFR